MSRSRRRRGGGQEPPRTPEQARAFGILGHMSARDHEMLKVTRSRVTMRSRGETTEVTVGEAVRLKVAEAAMAGNSHAAWLHLTEEARAEEAERARKLDDLAYWIGVQTRNRRVIDAALARGEVEPVVFPHPEDMRFDAEKIVTVLGPMTRGEHEKMLEALRQRDALLVQCVMGRVLDGHRWMDPENLPGTMRLALTLNAGLPPRKRWTRETLGGTMKQLFGLPKRELLKRAYRAMRAAGIPVARGERLVPRGTLAPLLDTLREVGTALLADREMSASEIEDHLASGLRARGVAVKG